MSQRPTALNQTVIALVRRWFNDQSHWLVLTDSEESERRFVEAERLEQESFRESIDREVAWQLGLRRGKDYIISSVPRLHLELPVTVNHECSGEAEARFDIVEFYLIELFGRQSRAALDQNSKVEWWNVERLLSDSSSTRLHHRHRDLLKIADFLNGDRKHAS